jgi:hypothetical protein
MAVFNENPEEWQRLDWQLLKNSPITLYFSPSVLERDLGWFAEHGDRVVSLRVAGDASREDVLVELGKLLDFPDYYGRNLDAFNDCLSDLDVPEPVGAAPVMWNPKEWLSARRGV